VTGIVERLEAVFGDAVERLVCRWPGCGVGALHRDIDGNRWCDTHSDLEADLYPTVVAEGHAKCAWCSKLTVRSLRDDPTVYLHPACLRAWALARETPPEQAKKRGAYGRRGK